MREGDDGVDITDEFWGQKTMFRLLRSFFNSIIIWKYGTWQYHLLFTMYSPRLRNCDWLQQIRIQIDFVNLIYFLPLSLSFDQHLDQSYHSISWNRLLKQQDQRRDTLPASDMIFSLFFCLQHDTCMWREKCSKLHCSDDWKTGGEGNQHLTVIGLTKTLLISTGESMTFRFKSTQTSVKNWCSNTRCVLWGKNGC